MRSTGYVAKAVALAAAFGLMAPVMAMDHDKDGLADDIPYFFIIGITATGLAKAEACGWPGGDGVAHRMAATLKEQMELTPELEKALLAKANKDGTTAFSSFDELFMWGVNGWRNNPQLAEFPCDRTETLFDAYNRAVEEPRTEEHAGEQGEQDKSEGLSSEQIDAYFLEMEKDGR